MTTTTVLLALFLSVLHLTSPVLAAASDRSDTPKNCVHGEAYPEDHALGLSWSCECHQCYVGESCSHLNESCAVDVTTVELSVATPWFIERASDVEASISAAYHSDYLSTPTGELDSSSGRDRVRIALNATIRSLHNVVGNSPANAATSTLVVGAGAMQVLSAAVHALSRKRKGQCSIFAQPPAWGCFRDIAEAQSPRVDFTFSSASQACMEIVTSPNNPDGREKIAVSAAPEQTIHDAVYGWPCFGQSDEPGSTHRPDAGVVVFSLSKLTGYAASRIGWAFVSDPEIADAMGQYIFMNGQGSGIEAEYRATRVLQAILREHSSFFDFVRKELHRRWSVLERALGDQRRFSIDGVHGHVFAWLRCHEDQSSEACAQRFAANGLRVSEGTEFGSNEPHVRVVMAQHESTFALMVQRINATVNEPAPKLPNSSPASAATPSRLARLSVHQHIVPRSYAQRLLDFNISLSDDLESIVWDAERTITEMRRHDVGAAVLSVSYPGCFFPQLPIPEQDKLDLAVELASMSNEYLFGPDVVTAFSPSPFGGFATLPLPGVDASVAELRRALDPPGFGGILADGVVLYSNYNGTYLGDELFDRVMVELDERSATVFLHPVSTRSPTPTASIPAWLLDFPFDTTRAIVNLIVKDAFRRFPNITWIVAHAGGTVPFLADRIEELKGDARYDVKGDPIGQMKELYFDTTNVESAGAIAMHSLWGLANLSKVVYGDDWPMMTEDELQAERDGLERYLDAAGASKALRSAVERNNALGLFPALAPALLETWEPRLGNYTLRISCPAAQNDFDQGLRIAFGFDQVEAKRFAQRCMTVDPSCAMCSWLDAYARSPFLNQPVVGAKEDFASAKAAAARASQLLDQSATSTEHVLINAMALRFGDFENQTEGYTEYSLALASAEKKMPENPDIGVFYAESLMLLHCKPEGYDFYDNISGKPKPDIAVATTMLERVMNFSEPHPFAEHLYIHVTEPSLPGAPSADHKFTAGRASEAAKHLGELLEESDSQHLQHMPSHTWLRTGAYAEAVRSNIVATASDADFASHDRVAYGPGHNAAFLVYAATMSGQRRIAYKYCDVLRDDVYLPNPDAPDGPGPEIGWHIWRTTRLRFGDYGQVLSDSSNLVRQWPYAHVLGSVARGLALLKTNHTVESARVELRKLLKIAPSVAESMQGLVRVANSTLHAAIVAQEQGPQAALPFLEDSVAEQTSWPYDEPPKWFMPMKQCLGVIQRRSGLLKDAFATFESDLVDFPNNAYSLLGSLQAGKLLGPGTVSPEAEGFQTCDSCHRPNSIVTAWSDADEDLLLSSPCALFE